MKAAHNLAATARDNQETLAENLQLQLTKCQLPPPPVFELKSSLHRLHAILESLCARLWRNINSSAVCRGANFFPWQSAGHHGVAQSSHWARHNLHCGTSAAGSSQGGSTGMCVHGCLGFAFGRLCAPMQLRISATTGLDSAVGVRTSAGCLQLTSGWPKLQAGAAAPCAPTRRLGPPGLMQCGAAVQAPRAADGGCARAHRRG